MPAVGGQSERGFDGFKVRQELPQLRFKLAVAPLDEVYCHIQFLPAQDWFALAQRLPLIAGEFYALRVEFYALDVEFYALRVEFSWSWG